MLLWTHKVLGGDKLEVTVHELPVPCIFLGGGAGGRPTTQRSSQARDRTHATAAITPTFIPLSYQGTPALHYLFWQVTYKPVRSFLCFLGPHPQHMEVPRLGVESELQLLVYTHSHSNAVAEPHLQPTPQLTAKARSLTH